MTALPLLHAAIAALTSWQMAAVPFRRLTTQPTSVLKRTPAQNSNDFASNRLIHHTLGRKFDFMQARPRCHNRFLAEA